MARRLPSDSYGVITIGGEDQAAPMPGWPGGDPAGYHPDAAAAAAEMAEMAAEVAAASAVKMKPSQAAGAAGAAGGAAASAAAEIAAQRPVRHAYVDTTPRSARRATERRRQYEADAAAHQMGNQMGAGNQMGDGNQMGAGCIDTLYPHVPPSGTSPAHAPLTAQAYPCLI